MPDSSGRRGSVDAGWVLDRLREAAECLSSPTPIAIAHCIALLKNTYEQVWNGTAAPFEWWDERGLHARDCLCDSCMGFDADELGLDPEDDCA